LTSGLEVFYGITFWSTTIEQQKLPNYNNSIPLFVSITVKQKQTVTT